MIARGGCQSRIYAMHVDVNGVRLWFDVEGLALVPDGSEMRQRPTVVLVQIASGPTTYGTRSSRCSSPRGER